MQWNHQDRVQIQDAQKIIPVQVIQGPIQQNIEEEWDRSYFMEDDFTSKEDTPNTATEVEEINTWNKTTTDNPIEAEILAEVNEVYRKYCLYPSHHGYWNTGPRSKNPRAPFRGGRGYHKSFTPRQSLTPEHYGGKPSLHI